MLLGNDVGELQDWEVRIGEFLAARLRLELNMNARRLASIHNGRNLSGQYRWFCRRYQKAIIVFQVGGYFEFYGHIGKFARNFFHLRPGTSRPRLGIRAGFSVDQLEKYLKTALTLWPQIVLIRQTGRVSGYVMERRVHSILHSETVFPV